MVLSTVSLVLKGLIDAVKTVYPDFHTVYDESLDYASSVEKLRDKYQKDDISSPIFPMFAYKRSVLRPSDAIPRATNIQVVDLSPESFADLYKSSHGMFDLDFLVYHTDIEFMESFEIQYLMWGGLKSIRNFTISIPGLEGNWIYQTNWDWLTDLKISVTSQYYKALMGKASVQGFFLALSAPPTYPKIKEIIKTIKTVYGEFLEGEHIY